MSSVAQHAHALPKQSATAGAAGTTHAHGGGSTTATGGGHGHGPELQVPTRGTLTASMLVDGSFGPTVKKGAARTITIEDGKGFGGVSGRKQNGGDKKQNNYSVTDANFYPSMGLLAKDPDTGGAMNYVKHIQAYNAAGYVSTFHPDIYAKLVEQQNAGNGTVLGSSLALLGIVQKPDPAMQAAGLQSGMLAGTSIPGTNGALNAREVVMSGTDITGQQWARPHHAESAWPVYKKMIDAGVDYQTAMILSGDDAVSGSGRLNGFNNQDGKTGLNADERAVYRLAAQYQAQTGIDVVGIMAGGHSHTGLDDSAKTNPNVNKLIGYAKGDRSNDPARINAIYRGLLNGTIGGDSNSTFKQLHKFDAKGKGAYKAVGGAAGGEAFDAIREKDELNKKPDAPKPSSPAQQGGATGGGGALPPVGQTAMPPMGGCGGDAIQGAGGVAGATGGDIAEVLAMLKRLVESLTALLDSLAATPNPVQEIPTQAPPPVQTPLGGGGGAIAAAGAAQASLGATAPAAATGASTLAGGGGGAAHAH